MEARTTGGVTVAGARPANPEFAKLRTPSRYPCQVVGFQSCSAASHATSSSPTERRRPALAQCGGPGGQQLPVTLRLAQVAVDGDRVLDRQPRHRIRPDADSDLPHPGRALPKRPCAASRHPYSLLPL